VIDLKPATDEVARLVDGVTDDQLGDPTPCADTSVARLLDHLMGLSLAFTWAARKTVPEDGGPPARSAAEDLDPEWRTVLPQRLRGLAEAWTDPAAWEGMTGAGGVRLPGEQAGVVALDEVVLHGWDLARGTGQAFTCDPVTAEIILGFTSAMAAPGQQLRGGLFGPAVDVPDDAPVLDRALGFAGRDPAWKP
jgi:uncharacterized protein (TIGR03086 family)